MHSSLFRNVLHAMKVTCEPSLLVPLLCLCGNCLCSTTSIWIKGRIANSFFLGVNVRLDILLCKRWKQLIFLQSVVCRKALSSHLLYVCLLCFNLIPLVFQWLQQSFDFTHREVWSVSIIFVDSSFPGVGISSRKLVAFFGYCLLSEQVNKM